jgi:hypothetical protein
MIRISFSITYLSNLIRPPRDALENVRFQPPSVAKPKIVATNHPYKTKFSIVVFVFEP